MRTFPKILCASLFAAYYLIPNDVCSQASLNFYVSVVGATQGPIDGSNVQKGRERTIVGYSLNHEATTPRDASGVATGKGQLKAITLVLDLDRATPLLLNAWSRNETLSSVTIKCYEAGSTSGTESNEYTITLNNAAISSIQTAIGPGRSNPQFPTSDTPSGTSVSDLVKVSLVYQGINISYNDLAKGTPITTFTGGM